MTGQRIESRSICSRAAIARRDCTALPRSGSGLARLVRLGRVAGIVSRGLLNRMQRDGVHVRMYSLLPGETVPCGVFPGDDLVVVAMAADFSGAEAVTLSVVTGPESSPMSEIDNVPVSGMDRELLWATPASAVRQLPSIRVAAHAQVLRRHAYVARHVRARPLCGAA